jgi:hypothetical protein
MKRGSDESGRSLVAGTPVPVGGQACCGEAPDGGQKG